MLRVDHARWGQTPADLRRLATSAPHPRTRERFLALYEITQESCATRIAERIHRHPQTVMEWLHLYNTGGPEALTYQRTGGPPPHMMVWTVKQVSSSAHPVRLAIITCYRLSTGRLLKGTSRAGNGQPLRAVDLMVANGAPERTPCQGRSRQRRWPIGQPLQGVRSGAIIIS